MSSPATSPVLGGASRLSREQYYAIGFVALAVVTPFFLWPRLVNWLVSTEFLPHRYCYAGSLGLTWTHVLADTAIGIAYLAISATLAYLVYLTRNDIPFPWMFLAFGAFIVACGLTHLVETTTVWLPIYNFSAVVKVMAAGISVATAIVLPSKVPKVLALIQNAKNSEEVTAQLRASEERKEALLREVHHRYKNNLAVICSLFYLQSKFTKDSEAVRIFRDMERRVHSMALVHESLYGSENLETINLAEYARDLTNDILSSHGSPVPVRLAIKLERVMMSVDRAILCGLILNELLSNAIKHAFPEGGGQIGVSLRCTPEGQCKLCVEDNGVGIPADLDIKTTKSMGLRLVRSLTRQLRGTIDLRRTDQGTTGCLEFTVE